MKEQITSGKPQTRAALFLLSLISAACCFGFVLAAFPQLASAQSPFDLIIIPNKKEYFASPGQKIRGSIKVRNDGEIGIKGVAPATKNFTANDQENGDPKILDTMDNSYRYHLAEWMEFDKTPHDIEPNGSINIEYVINVPSDAEPGGHYGIFYVVQGSSTTGTTTLGFQGQLGSLILVTVSGDVKVEGNILEFYTGKKLYEYLPVDFYVRMQNSGNVHFAPSGTIFVYDWQDKNVGNFNMNEQAGVVLPGSIRKYQSYWMDSFITSMVLVDANGVAQTDAKGQKKTQLQINWKNWNIFRLGRYSAKAIVVYDDANQQERQLVASTYFWVIPWKLILGIVGGILILTMLIRFFLKLYNRRLIRKYEKTQEVEQRKVADEVRKRLEKKKKRAERRSRLRSSIQRIRRGFGGKSDKTEPATGTQSEPQPGDRKSTAFDDPDRLKWESDDK